MTLRRVRIAAFAASVPLLMRLPLPALDRLLSRRPRAAVRDPAGTAADVEAVLTHPTRLIRRGCLTRGLTRYFFLRSAGTEVALCFGVGRIDTALEGHCWIELGGEPLHESRDPRALFTETYRLPRP